MGPVVNKRLKLFQPPCREIIVAMPFKSEIRELAEVFSLPIGHECGDKVTEWDVVCGKTACSISVQIVEVVLHGEREKSHAVVEERSERNGFVPLVVNYQAEVAEVPVCIADECVKDDHVAERLIKGVAHLFELSGDFRELELREKAMRRDKRMVYVGEKGTRTAKHSLPLREVVRHMIYAHGRSYLSSVILGIWFVSCVGRP